MYDNVIIKSEMLLEVLLIIISTVLRFLLQLIKMSVLARKIHLYIQMGQGNVQPLPTYF